MFEGEFSSLEAIEATNTVRVPKTYQGNDQYLVDVKMISTRSPRWHSHRPTRHLSGDYCLCPVAAGTMSPSITCGTNVARNSLLVKIIREIETLKLLVVNVVLFTGVGAP